MNIQPIHLVAGKQFEPSQVGVVIHEISHALGYASSTSQSDPPQLLKCKIQFWIYSVDRTRYMGKRVFKRHQGTTCHLPPIPLMVCLFCYFRENIIILELNIRLQGLSLLEYKRLQEYISIVVHWMGLNWKMQEGKERLDHIGIREYIKMNT